MRVKSGPPRTLFSGRVDLSPGQEWHSHPINAARGDRITVTALGKGSNFRMGLFKEIDYVTRFNPDGPFWRLNYPRDTKWVVEKKCWFTGNYRLVIRVGKASPKATILVTITRTEPVRKVGRAGDEATRTPELPIGGEKLGPYSAWDNVEAIGVVIVVLIILAGLVIVNIVIVGHHWQDIETGDSLAISLLQADAEWAIFLAALYVAVKQLPEWLRKRGEGK
jgi:hypothetical protein